MSAVSQIQAGARITAAAIQGIAPLAAVRGSTQSVTSSTVLVNDDTLALALVANATYLITGCLYYTGASSAGNLKYGWTVPASATGPYQSVHADTSLSFTGAFAAVFQTGTINAGTNGGSSVMAASISGTISTTGTPGTLQLQWAQAGSNGTATVMQVGSFLAAWRIV